MHRRPLLFTLPALLAACAALPGSEPLKVHLVGLEALPGQGLELRLAVKLRLQNPNGTAADFDGIALDLELRGLAFASGVSDARGSVPRFGELVIDVPLTVSATALVRQAYSLATEQRGKLDFVARGRLGGGLFGGLHFSSSGQLDWPAAR